MTADEIRKHWNVQGNLPPELLNDFALVEIAAQLAELNEARKEHNQKAALEIARYAAMFAWQCAVHANDMPREQSAFLAQAQMELQTFIAKTIDAH